MKELKGLYILSLKSNTHVVCWSSLSSAPELNTGPNAGGISSGLFIDSLLMSLKIVEDQ